VGIIVAGFIEYGTLRSLTVGGLFGVGLIEESAKLTFPVVIYLQAVYRSESDGLLFGVAAGMGFAALETMGYGLVALIQSRGDVGVLQETLLIRGLLSPVGHAAWTGLICASLWHERERTGKLLNGRVLAFFAVAVALHALWDLAGTFGQVLAIYLGYTVVGGVSLVLLVRRLNEAKRLAPSA
jgi:RsiW-degrading membrane proteinase PrsW (M82 family)